MQQKNQTVRKKDPPYNTEFQGSNWKEIMATYRTNVLLSCLNSLNFRSVCHRRIVRKHLLCLIFIFFLKIQTVNVNLKCCVYMDKRDREKEKMALLFPILLLHGSIICLRVQSTCWCNSKIKEICRVSKQSTKAHSPLLRQWFPPQTIQTPWEGLPSEVFLSLQLTVPVPVQGSSIFLSANWLSLLTCFHAPGFMLCFLTSDKDASDYTRWYWYLELR